MFERFRGNLRGDIFGGVTAGIVALPLALAFGVASGLPNGAAAGLYGAFAVGLFAALFGGTPVQVSGPTGPMTVVVAGLVPAVSGHPDWIFAAVALAGVFQMLIGVVGLGRYVRYVPYPVVSGFMTGIGAIVVVLQIAPLVGRVGARGTLEAVRALPQDLAAADRAALGLGLATIALVYLLPRLTRRVPSSLLALVSMSALAWALDLDVPRIADVPRGMPAPLGLGASSEMLAAIVGPALILAFVGSIDTLLTSLVADALTRTRHDSRRELIGQGIGNLAAGLLGGLPGAGATMRTVVNFRSGGRTHLSGVVHALLLLAVLLALAPLAEVVPIAVLAGILVTVGIGIVDRRGLRDVLRVPREDAVVMLVVLATTVFVDLMWAVAVGVVLAALFLLKRLSDLDPATPLPLVVDGDDLLPRTGAPPRLPAAVDGIQLVDVHGAVFFGNAEALRDRLRQLGDPRGVVLLMARVPYVDQSGVYSLAEVFDELRRRGVEVYLVGLRAEPLRLLQELDVVPDRLPADHVVDRVEDAVARLTARSGEPGRRG